VSEMTRRDAIKLATVGAALVTGALTANAADAKVGTESGDQKWDCLRNKTGKALLITLASGNTGGPGYYVPADATLEFQVRNTTQKMAYVAYEYGTNKLVRMEEFTVLHQSYPPTNCLNITGTKAERHKMEEAGRRASPPASPPPY
jgi:hypothetical protein